jgi:hypothetical protein
MPQSPDTTSCPVTAIQRRYSVLAILLLTIGVQPGCSGHTRREALHTAPQRSKSSERLRTWRSSEALPSISRLSHSQRAHFAILRSRPERLPRSVTTTLRHPTYGANWRLAQKLDTGTQTRVWMLPANGSVCLVEQQHGNAAVGVTCTAVSHALEHGVVTASLAEGASGLSPTRRLVVGVAPDRVPKVRIRTPGAGSAVVRVTHNTFVLRDWIGEPPESVELLRRG